MSNLSNVNHLQTSQFKAAVVQAAPVVFDLEATLVKLKGLAKQAVDSGAKLVVFPEAFLSGYPKGTTFGSYIGGRTLEGRKYFEKYYRSSIDVPGPVVDELSDLAKTLGIFLVVGCIERGGSTLYCTVIFFDPIKGYLGKHRKLMPTAGEKMVWGFGDGSTLPVFDTAIGNLGAVICWENYMPLLRTHMYQQNIQLYCAPTADDRESWVGSMQHIAKEGRCYVFSSCQFSRRKDYPSDYPTLMSEDPEAVYMKGGSCIVNPMGEIIAGPNFERETILYADVDLSKIIQYRWDFDVVGHYARPDVFKMTANCEDRSLSGTKNDQESVNSPDHTKAKL